MNKKAQNIILGFTLLVLMVFSLSSFSSVEENQPLAMKGGVLIDGTGASAINDLVVVISNGRIAKLAKNL